MGDKSLEHQFLIEILERYKELGHNEGVIPISFERLGSNGFDYAYQFDNAVLFLSESFNIRLQTCWRGDPTSQELRWLFAYRILEFT